MSPPSFYSELIPNAMHRVCSKSYSHSFVFFLFTVLLFLLLHPILSDADNTNLVYKVCADQKLDDDPSGIYSQNLQTLLVSLVAQSEQMAFFTTTLGEGQNVMMGLYQCRGDLSNTTCYNCVSKIPDMLENLCGKVVAARVQLIGCYLRYEIVGFKQVPETQLLYKVCGSKKESYYDDGFEERRDYAFGMVENGVRSGGSYQSLDVLGQCEGDLANDDCGDCVKSAEDQAKAECGDSISAEIYLYKCFVSYSFSSKGVSPMPSSSPGGVPPMSSSPGSPPGQQDSTMKAVAITVGVLAGLGFLIVCFLYLKSMLKKKGYEY